MSQNAKKKKFQNHGKSLFERNTWFKTSIRFSYERTIDKIKLTQENGSW